MDTEQDKYVEKSIDVNDVEQDLERVLNESEGVSVAVVKEGTPVFYCVPADTYAAMLEAIEASEMGELSARVHQLGLDVFGNEETFKSWMKKPAIALEGKSPELMMVTKEGIQRVSDLLGKIDHGFIF